MVYKFSTRHHWSSGRVSGPATARARSLLPVRLISMVLLSAVVAGTLGLLIAPSPVAARSSTETSTTAPDSTTPTSDVVDDATPAPEGTTTTIPGATTTVGGASPVPCRVAMVVGCVLEDGTVIAAVNPPTDDTTAVAGTQVAAADDDRPVKSGLDPWERGGLRTNFGTDSIPLSNYQIGADVTGLLGVPDPLDAFVASQTNWAFTTTTFLVILATNAMEWAFEFPLAENLVGDAGVLAQSYTIDFFGFGLSTSVYGLALSVTMIFAGFKAVTKGLIVAGTEIMLAFVAYVLLIILTVTSSFGDIGLRVSSISSDISASIASFAAGQDRQAECSLEISAETVDLAGATAETDPDAPVNPAADSSACTFGHAIQRSLVELPYQNLQWGQVLDGVEGKEDCARINRELLVEGPWGNSDEPRDRMRAVSACEENADFNHEASYIRLGIASANAISAAAVTLLVLVVAAMLLWQQLKLLFLTATLPHALVFAILPGGSRRIAWQWVEHLMGVVIRTVVLALGLVVWLSLYSLIVYEQLSVQGIFLSLFASVAMSVGGFYGLYRLSGLTRRLNPTTPKVIQKDDDGDRGGRSGRGDGGERSGSATAVKVAQSTLRTVRRRQGATTPQASGPSSAGGARRPELAGR